MSQEIRDQIYAIGEEISKWHRVWYEAGLFKETATNENYPEHLLERYLKSAQEVRSHALMRGWDQT